MSVLQEFVLEYVNQIGGLAEPAVSGVHEIVLPDDVAQQWRLPAYQQVAFDEVSDTTVTRLGYHHPMVEEAIASARAQVVPTRVYINDLRLDKTGLAELARTTWALPNSRVTESRNSVIARVRSSYLLFNFKATLLSDEKREQVVSVVIDANAGHAAADPERILQVATATEPDATVKSLSEAPIRWGAIEAEAPTDWHALPSLEHLLQRAQTAVLHDLSEPLRNLEKRTQRFRELDEARLEEYYDEIARDLQQRLASAQSDRRAGIEEKLSAVAAERSAKMTDVAERYQARLELTLLNLMVITQSKLALPVTIASRTASAQTFAVWDPLLHRLEPLVCTVCGEPSDRTVLCHHGHLAHADCLAPFCIDCKRAFCLQCADTVEQCAVCEQPLCRYSQLACQQCGRGTCKAHTGLCHANAGQPAALSTPEPIPEVSAPAPASPPPSSPSKPVPTPKTRTKSAPKKPPLHVPSRHAGRAPAPVRLPAGVPKPQRLEVVAQHDSPVVTAFVVGSRERQVAARGWELTPDGIGVFCKCEKGDACPDDGVMLWPTVAAGIEEQLKAEIDGFRREYGLPTKKVNYSQRVGRTITPQRRFALAGDWKSDDALTRARGGFQRLVAQRHGS